MKRASSCTLNIEQTTMATKNATKTKKFSLADITKTVDGVTVPTLHGGETYTTFCAAGLVGVKSVSGRKSNVFSIQAKRPKFVPAEYTQANCFTVFTAFIVEPLDGDIFTANGNSGDKIRPHVLTVSDVTHLQRYIDALSFSNMTCVPAASKPTTKKATASKPTTKKATAPA